VIRAPVDGYRLGVALAGPRVAANAPLLGIARRAQARCAINGTFFAAYAGETGEPYGTLVVRGRLLHLGGFGTRLDVLRDGRLRFVRDRLVIRGALDGGWDYPDNWYAYNINHTPTPHRSSVEIYTPDRGRRLGFRPDMAVTARAGRVAQIQRWADAAIPPDGFVVAIQGSQELHSLGWKFAPGRRIEYRAVDADGPLETRFSLGAGPRLLEHGAVSVSPIAEGFRDPKIVAMKGRRSAIGLTAGREILFVIIDRATIDEAALVMRRRGAIEAMNLDDNASSGLVCDGRYLVQPGRAVANALVLWPASP
jgi:hypothetical protein